MRQALLCLLLCGCSAQLGPVRCATDDHCAPGSYCSVGGLCADAASCAGKPDPACAVLAPTGVSAVGGQNQVSLAWNTIGGATGYGVRRSIHAGGPYSDLPTLASAGLLDQGLSAATRYYYLVHAIGPGGPGADSAEASALTVPATPANLTATPGAGAITLNWDPSPGVTGYRISRASADDGVYQLLINAPATPASYLDSGLVAGKTFSYVVAALNASGASARSTAATATAN